MIVPAKPVRRRHVTPRWHRPFLEIDVRRCPFGLLRAGRSVGFGPGRRGAIAPCPPDPASALTRTLEKRPQCVNRFSWR
jgi:hypothetical protein